MTPAEKLHKHLLGQGTAPEEIQAAVASARLRLDGSTPPIPVSLAAHLATLPIEEQDALLGARKANLFRAGKVAKARELVACADRPLKASEL